MNERIKEIRKRLGLTQQEFADVLKITRSAVCKMESGENAPSAQTLSIICREFDVNENWLRTGEGEMFIEKTKDEQIAEMLADIKLAGEESFQHRLAAAFSAFNADDWKEIERLYNKLTGKQI